MLAISLMRLGAKGKPFYRLVVKEKRSKRDGKYLENVGTYNPHPGEVVELENREVVADGNHGDNDYDRQSDVHWAGNRTAAKCDAPNDGGDDEQNGNHGGAAVRKVRQRLQKPPYTTAQYLTILTRQRLVATVAELEQISELI